MKTIFCLPIIVGILSILPYPAVAQQVMVNEFHYDNLNADVDEFIEIAGVAGTNMSGWKIYMYNGFDGATYSNFSLSGTLGTTCTVSGQNIGVQVYDVFALTGNNSFQNGQPDGFALVNGSTVVELISYEGTFTGTNGPANGLFFPDCGAMEPSTCAIGSSIQRDANDNWTFLDGSNTFGACNSSQGILPVEMLYFRANAADGAVVLDWATASEHQNEQFEVEHSTDGRQFATIGTVKGAGESSTTLLYQFTDPAPQKGRNYYRLRQVDYGGAATYSKMITATIGRADDIARLSPNPSGGQVKLNYTAETEGTLELSLISAEGRLVHQTVAEVTKGANQLTFNWTELPKGAYMVRLRNGQSLLTKRLLLR